MHLIIIAVVVVSVIGLIAGLGLAVASKVMAVPVDEKAEEIQAALPGANCGACGFSGCSGYAAALSEGKTTDTGRCMPGGAEVSHCEDNRPCGGRCHPHDRRRPLPGQQA